MAEVLAIGNECDLALLTVRNEAFWQGAKLLKLGSLPRLKVNSYKVDSALGTEAQAWATSISFRCDDQKKCGCFGNAQIQAKHWLSGRYRQRTKLMGYRLFVCIVSCDDQHAICRTQSPC